MIRVLVLASLFPDASRPVFGPFVERQTLALAAHPDVELQIVAPLGIPPWPFSLHPHYGDLRALPDEEEWKGVKVYRPRFHHIPATQGRYDAGRMVSALLPLLKSIRTTFRFDVIDAEFFFPDGPAAVALGKALGVPVSIKARGSDIHLWGVSQPTASQVVAAGRQAQGLLAVSAALKADMVKLSMPEEKIKVHYTGVDLDQFQPLDRVKTKAMLGIVGPLIACVGALNVNKGQLILVEALSQIPDAHLVLIGKGDIRADIVAKASVLGVSERVIFTGSIGPEKIAQWLGAADVMALASASEGLANAWLEALASGTPVVTCNVGGALEVIDRPAAGILVDRSADAFAAGISQILANPPTQAAVRETAARFTWPRNTQMLYEHLSGLINH
jgi:teichuronic acid biosynthesis glycosyltransferase TuaC